MDIDEKVNSLQFYSSASYNIKGTNTKVPVQAGQLRSFTNVLGTFNAQWSTDGNGAGVFGGYKNDKGQDLGAAAQEFKEWSTGLKGLVSKYFMWGSKQYEASQEDPVGYNLKLTTTMLTVSALAAVEPIGYSPGYNPSVTTQESMSGLGTLRFATTNGTTTLAPYWPANGGALGEWYQATTVPGATLDRIGGLGGRYLAPYGTPFEMRALSTNGIYRAFKVMKPFPVEVSNTAPAFGRFGGGIQYRTPINIEDLLNLGFLKQIK